MDNRPIGVFDSGLGGLTAVKELSKILPNEDIIYFGDTSRVPYGTRSNETIIKYVRQDIKFLKSNDIKAVVAACGTASSVALPYLINEFNIPLIGVLEPVCAAAATTTKNKKIGILGTQGTINSGSYQKGIREIDKTMLTFEKACPMFVPLVENGYIDSTVTYIIAREYIEPLVVNGIDTIILGCTHYPLLTKVIKDITENKIAIINAGTETAIYTKKVLSKLNLLTSNNNKGNTKYYVSDNVESFSYLGSMFLESSMSNVAKIDIEQY